MKEVWFKGHEDREKRAKQLASFRTAFEELEAVLLAEFPAEVNVDYSQAGWAGRLAHNVGERKAFQRVLNLIKE